MMNKSSLLLLLVCLPISIFCQKSSKISQATSLDLQEDGTISLKSPTSIDKNNVFEIIYHEDGINFFDNKQSLTEEYHTLKSSNFLKSKLIEVFGGGGDDVLIVDFRKATKPIHIKFDGQNNFKNTQGDILEFFGSEVDLLEHIFYNENDGIVHADEHTIEYIGLEPVIDNLMVANRVFNFTGGTETITISDDLTPNDNLSRVNSTLSELVDFLHPTATLTINAGTGDDVVNFNGLDINMPIPTITIDGGIGTNQLIIDAQGNTYINNGSSVAITGSHTINYTNFNSVTVINGTSCPTAVIVTNDQGSVCHNEGTDDLVSWQTSVMTNNPLNATQDPLGLGQIVYSSVLPVAGVTPPDGILPTGILNDLNNGISETQSVGAYLYCDSDNSGTVNAIDNYTLISTYTLTVNVCKTPPIPTLSQWGLIILGLLMVNLGLYAVNLKQRI